MNGDFVYSVVYGPKPEHVAFFSDFGTAVSRCDEAVRAKKRAEMDDIAAFLYDKTSHSANDEVLEKRDREFMGCRKFGLEEMRVRQLVAVDGRFFVKKTWEVDDKIPYEKATDTAIDVTWNATRPFEDKVVYVAAFYGTCFDTRAYSDARLAAQELRTVTLGELWGEEPYQVGTPRNITHPFEYGIRAHGKTMPGGQPTVLVPFEREVVRYMEIV